MSFESGKYVNMREYRKCLHVACSKCGSSSGFLCFTVNGEYARIPHVIRLKKLGLSYGGGVPRSRRVKATRVDIPPETGERMDYLINMPLAVAYGWNPVNWEGRRKTVKRIIEEVERDAGLSVSSLKAVAA